MSISLKQLETNQNEFLFSEILVHNRDDFMQFVLTNKLASEVAKIRENQFSLIPTFGKKPIYFQGEIYERQFDIRKCSKPFRERIKAFEQVRKADSERGNDEQRTVNQISKNTRMPCAELRDRAEKTLQGARQARAAYNRQRYASATTSEKRDSDFNQRIEIISSRVEAEYQQYSNDAFFTSQRNRSDHAKASSAEQSPIATYDQRQSESDQSPNSGQYPKYHTVIRRSEESVAAASSSSINSVDHLQPEINSENIYFDVAWNGVTEYFSNIALQLLSHTADLNQKRDRNLDGRRRHSIPSDHLLEMDRLQYPEFEQKESPSDRTEYSSDISLFRGEVSYERTATYDYSTSQRQRYTADDFGFTRTNEFSFDAIIAEYYARLARKRREDEKRLSVIEHYEQSNRDDMNKILKILGFSNPSELSHTEISLFQNIGLMIKELQSRQEKLEQLEQQQQLQHQKEQQLQEQSMSFATQISRLEHLTTNWIKRFDVLEKQESNLKQLQLQQQKQIKDLNEMMLNCIQSMSNLNKICVDLENKQMQIKSMQQQCNSNANSIESIQQSLQQQYCNLQNSLKKLSG